MVQWQVDCGHPSPPRVHAPPPPACSRRRERRRHTQLLLRRWEYRLGCRRGSLRGRRPFQRGWAAGADPSGRAILTVAEATLLKPPLYRIRRGPALHVALHVARWYVSLNVDRLIPGHSGSYLRPWHGAEASRAAPSPQSAGNSTARERRALVHTHTRPFAQSFAISSTGEPQPPLCLSIYLSVSLARSI